MRTVNGSELWRQQSNKRATAARHSPKRAVGGLLSALELRRRPLCCVAQVRQNLRVRRILLLGLGISACGSPPAKVVYQARVVTQPGGTCGIWQETPVSAAQAVVIQANCASDMTCVIEVQISPPGKQDGSLGRCLPNDTPTCDAGFTECSHGLVCAAGVGISSTGQCFVGCNEPADCPSPYQTCDYATCLFRRCTQLDGGGNPCFSGESCVDGVCTVPPTH
jgi:hypothetical protein